MGNQQKKYYFGLDPALNSSGWAIIYLEDGQVHLESLGHIRSKKNASLQNKLCYIRNQLLQIIPSIPFHFTVVKEYPFHRNHKATIKLHLVHGVILRIFANFPVLEVLSSSMRKLIGRHGEEATKEDVKNGVLNILGVNYIDFKSDDQPDAAEHALCYLFQQNLLPAIKLPHAS